MTSKHVGYVYPFNHKDHYPCDANNSNSQSSGPSTSNGDSSNTSSSSHREFTDEEESHFARRYRKQYDLTDPRYSAWLEVNHLTEPCQELSQCSSDVLSLEPIDMSAMDSTSSEYENTDLQATVIDHDVTPGLTPTRVVNHSVDYPISMCSQL